MHYRDTYKLATLTYSIKRSGHLHIYMNYYKTTNQPILSALLLMACLRLLVLDLLHLVSLDILQLPLGTLYQSISAIIVTLSLPLNVD